MKKRYMIGIFVVTAFLCVCCQLLVLFLIPRQKIQKKCEEAAYFYYDRYLFPEALSGIPYTTLDYYADCILVNLTYEMDRNEPLKAVICNHFYADENLSTDIELMEAVFHGVSPNQTYGRYWHGSIIFLRLLLCFVSIPSIYTIYTFLLFFTLVLCAISFIVQKEYKLAIFLLFSFSAAGGFYVGLCLEYVWCFLLMFLFSMLSVGLSRKNMGYLYLLYICSGVMTCFFDFLTAETLTLTVPLLCVLCQEHPKLLIRNKWKFTCRAIALWTISYAGMFILKWSLFAFTAGKEMLSDITGRVCTYMNGNILQALENNRCGMPCFFLLVSAVCYKKCFPKEKKTLYAILLAAILPIMRFILLSTHSSIHYFFTYRAQMATIFVTLELLYACFRYKRGDK